MIVYPKCKGCQDSDPENKPLSYCSKGQSQYPYVLCPQCAGARGMQAIAPIDWPPTQQQ